jgi:transcriptional regulator with XRE-family HTH domain
MTPTTSFKVSQLIRRLRAEAGLTQSELAARVGTTQSVISRLENDDYEGHSLSMLYRIGAALNRKIAVTATGGDMPTLSVREDAPAYNLSAGDRERRYDGAASIDFDRFAERIAQRLAEQGVAESDVREAILWARRGEVARSLEELRGAIKVGPGDVLDDVRRARAQRGRDTGARP